MNHTRSVTCNTVVIALLIVSTVIIIWGTGPAPHTDEGTLRSVSSMDHTSRQNRLDAIIVLMGGQTRPDGGVPLWVARRLDRAAELQRSQSEPLPPIVCSGAGTGAVPPVLTPEKFVMHEVTSGTKYLHDTWNVAFSLLMKEWSSYDTEGNAYFTLVQFAIPAGWRRIAIVTSEFHMPRSKALFEWIYGLQGAGTGHSHSQALTDASKHDPRSQGYLLEYHSVSDEGLEEQALKIHCTSPTGKMHRGSVHREEALSKPGFDPLFHGNLIGTERGGVPATKNPESAFYHLVNATELSVTFDYILKNTSSANDRIRLTLDKTSTVVALPVVSQNFRVHSKSRFWCEV